MTGSQAFRTTRIKACTQRDVFTHHSARAGWVIHSLYSDFDLSHHPNKSRKVRAITLVARRKSSKSSLSSARLAWLSSTVRGPAP